MGYLEHLQAAADLPRNLFGPITAETVWWVFLKAGIDVTKLSEMFPEVHPDRFDDFLASLPDDFAFDSIFRPDRGIE